jgi:hypothetical protein
MPADSTRESSCAKTEHCSPEEVAPKPALQLLCKHVLTFITSLKLGLRCAGRPNLQCRHDQPSRVQVLQESGDHGRLNGFSSSAHLATPSALSTSSSQQQSNLDYAVPKDPTCSADTTISQAGCKSFKSRGIAAGSTGSEAAHTWRNSQRCRLDPASRTQTWITLCRKTQPAVQTRSTKQGDCVRSPCRRVRFPAPLPRFGDSHCVSNWKA